MYPDEPNSEGLITLVPLMHAGGHKFLKLCIVALGLEEDPGVVSGCCGLFGSPQGETPSCSHTIALAIAYSSFATLVSLAFAWGIPADVFNVTQHLSSTRLAPSKPLRAAQKLG